MTYRRPESGTPPTQNAQPTQAEIRQIRHCSRCTRVPGRPDAEAPRIPLVQVRTPAVQSGANSLEDGERVSVEVLGADANDAPAEGLEHREPIDILHALIGIGPVLVTVVLHTHLPLPPAHVDVGDEAGVPIADRQLRCGRRKSVIQKHQQRPLPATTPPSFLMIRSPGSVLRARP